MWNFSVKSFSRKITIFVKLISRKKNSVLLFYRIALVSNGLGRTYQPARLGIYSATALLNGRYYYTHELGSIYNYYNDVIKYN